LSGSWSYLEDDWVAAPGTFIYEPVGESHSFVVYSLQGMTGLFMMDGPITLVDQTGKDLLSLGG
jgi:2,4'-dihydroxyacetophenone dioxygenase